LFVYVLDKQTTFYFMLINFFMFNYILIFNNIKILLLYFLIIL